MPLDLGWAQILVRLVLSCVAGALIGLNRGAHGHAAGFRTMTLLCLASAVAMIQANILLSTPGKAAGLFATMDIMRLPLGILSGIGFIGAGAILQKSGQVRGITTAAMLWMTTIIGLCLGGGQLGLGCVATALSLVILQAFQRAEAMLPLGKRAVLMLELDAAAPPEPTIRTHLADAGMRIASTSATIAPHATMRRVRYEVRWRGRATESALPPAIDALAKLPGIRRLHWQPHQEG